MLFLLTGQKYLSFMCLETPFWVWFFKNMVTWGCLACSHPQAWNSCVLPISASSCSWDLSEAPGEGMGRSRRPGIVLFCFFFLKKAERKIFLRVQEQDPQRGTWNSFPQLGCPDFGFAKPFYTDPGKYGGFNMKNNWAVSVVCPDNVSALVTCGLVFSCKVKQNGSDRGWDSLF